MAKVAINSCYGGFSLSAEAADLLFNKLPQEHPGKGELAEQIGYNEVNIHKYGKGTIFTDVHLPASIPRHDKYLIEVIEELGSEKASGSCAEVRIGEIPGNKYRISEYDGWESIEYPEKDYYWEVVE